MYLIFKRLVDLLLSFIALLVLSPLFLFIFISIKVESPGPVLFKQKRVGRYKKHFYILKFRTMRMDTPKDTPTHLLKDPLKYITRVGRFLRKTSLDELPQLINIIKGDMSIIGPRPALWNQEDLIKERDLYNVYNIHPGLTGYAQVKGRDKLPILVKAKLDGFYANNIGLALDIKIFFITIFRIIKSEGIVEGKSDFTSNLNNYSNENNK